MAPPDRSDSAHRPAGYVGRPMLRREDVRFVQGHGHYVDDVALPGAAWCAFVRSPHAHAAIKGIQRSEAAAMPGVLRVLTAEEWERPGTASCSCVHPMPFSDGRPMNEAPRPAFAARQGLPCRRHRRRP